MAKKKAKKKKIKDEYFDTSVCFICRKKFTKRQKRIKQVNTGRKGLDEHVVYVCSKCHKKQIKETESFMIIARILNELLPIRAYVLVPHDVPEEFKE